MVNVKNISDQPQHFTGMPTFKPGETRDVSREDAEYLSKSPHMEVIEGKPTKVKGVSNDRSVKGVENE